MWKGLLVKLAPVMGSGENRIFPSLLGRLLTLEGFRMFPKGSGENGIFSSLLSRLLTSVGS